LNFIHKDLRQNIARKIPVNDNPHFEIYHRATFQGVELDVCVYFPPPQNENGKECYAMVKVVDDDFSSEGSAPIYIDAMFNADAKADSFTEKNATLTKNYWAPRWKACSSAYIPLKATHFLRCDNLLQLSSTCYKPEHKADLFVVCR